MTIISCIRKRFAKFGCRYRCLSNGMDPVETPLSKSSPIRCRWAISIYWLPILVCGVLIFIVDVFQLQEYYTRIVIKQQSNNEELLIVEQQQSLKGFLIKTTGCRIPFMDPFDKSVQQFIKTEQPIICNENKPPLIESNFTSIYINQQSLIYYNITNLELLQCCYQPFYRREPKKNENDNKIEYDPICYNFTNQQNIGDSFEFVKVKCRIDNQIFIDYFSFVPLKNRTSTTKQQDDHFNVLIVGLDAMSRLNFHRQMPKTVDYLLKNLSAIEFYGYNKVADNTYPNLIPVLTGFNETELLTVCYNKTKRFDDCPLLWYDFRDKNFITAFGEDSSWMGLFNYQRNGFIKQPTDYMWGVFNRYVEQEIGNQHHGNVKHCIGSREVYRVLLDYMRNFIKRMHRESLNYFGFFWMASLSHDFLNTPQLGDFVYLEFFQYLQQQQFLNRTILIVMSDHGLRFGPIRQTYQGRMEERLPFLYFILPDWYRRQYPEIYRNLQKNQRRLTTPFDLHETLKQLLLPIANLTTTKSNQQQQRGYSLFVEIPENRTCEDASISTHWCTCLQSIEIDINNTQVRNSANFVINYINNELLIGYRQCAKLQLKEIINARKMSHGKHLQHSEHIRNDDYILTISTIPGNAIFEMTVRTITTNTTTTTITNTNSTITNKNNAVDDKKTYHYEILGTISRLNLYGKQSACITDFHLKLYCYCISIF